MFGFAVGVEGVDCAAVALTDVNADRASIAVVKSVFLHGIFI
jgi:hypothetical protein